MLHLSFPTHAYTHVYSVTTSPLLYMYTAVVDNSVDDRVHNTQVLCLSI